MTKIPLFEYQKPELMETEITESVTVGGQKQKDLYMKGIFVQGDIRNQNQRIYPVNEICGAVDSLNNLIKENISIFGECDHPTGLNINLDRISHVITSMWMEGSDGCGKLKIIPTPMGNIIKTILENKCKLGVSSRGSGNVNESNGYVSDFEIVTVDIVATPSAPNAYPTPVYEGLLNMNHGYKGLDIARESNTDYKTQKYLKDFVTGLIKDLKLK
jgi:hypothetical protein